MGILLKSTGCREVVLCRAQAPGQARALPQLHPESVSRFSEKPSLGVLVPKGLDIGELSSPGCGR